MMMTMAMMKIWMMKKMNIQDQIIGLIKLEAKFQLAKQAKMILKI